MGLVFGRRVSDTDVFVGGVTGSGSIMSGHTAVPPIPVDHITVMRKKGIRRLFIGEPLGEGYDIGALRQAGTADMGQGIHPMRIIIIRNYEELAARIPPGPDSIFCGDLLEPEAVTTKAVSPKVTEAGSQGGAVDEDQEGKEETSQDATISAGAPQVEQEQRGEETERSFGFWTPGFLRWLV